MRECVAVILGGGRGTRLFPLTRERSKPAVPLAVEVMKTGLFKKGDHVELGVIHESRWRGLQPYSHGLITQVRIQWRGGVAHEDVRFVQGLADGVLSAPEPFLQSWGLGPADSVVVRPAP